MQFLTVLKTILSLLPLLVQFIQQVEQASPVTGQGAAKLELIKQLLLSSAEVSDDLSTGQIDRVWPALQKTIAALVGLFNSTGTFSKG